MSPLHVASPRLRVSLSVRTFPFLKLVFFTLAPLLLVSLSAGCSVLDLPDPPTFELNDNDRSCRVDTDCAGVEIVSERGTLLADSVRTGDDGEVACLVVSVICSPIHNVCEAEVRVRDGIPNLLRKAKSGDGREIRVAYLGGSITAAPGWRVKSLEAFRKRYPAVEWTDLQSR